MIVTYNFRTALDSSECPWGTFARSSGR